MVEENQQSDCLWNREGREGVTGKGDEETFWAEVRFYILVGGWITQMHICIQIHRMYIKVCAFLKRKKIKQY